MSTRINKIMALLAQTHGEKDVTLETRQAKYKSRNVSYNNKERIRENEEHKTIQKSTANSNIDLIDLPDKVVACINTNIRAINADDNIKNPTLDTSSILFDESVTVTAGMNTNIIERNSENDYGTQNFFIEPEDFIAITTEIENVHFKNKENFDANQRYSCKPIRNKNRTKNIKKKTTDETDSKHMDKINNRRCNLNLRTRSKISNVLESIVQMSDSDSDPYKSNDTDDEFLPSDVSATTDEFSDSYIINDEYILSPLVIISINDNNDLHDNKNNNNVNNTLPQLKIRTNSLGENNKIVPTSLSIGTHNKVFFCIFSKKRVRRFARHIISMHKKEPKVMDIIRFPVKHPGRQRLISKIRNEGTFLYNNSSTHNEGDIIVTRRPNSKNKRKMKEYLPCPNCNAYFISKNLYRHVKKCSPKTNRTACLKFAKAEAVALQLQLNYKHLDFNANISELLKDLKNDIVSDTIKNDHLLLRLASYLSNKYRSEMHLKYYIRQKLRQLARLLLTIKESNLDIVDLEDCLQPRNFFKVTKGVQILCKLNENGEVEIPSMAEHLGIYLKEIVNVMYTACIIAQDEEKKKTISDFKDLLNNVYGAAISQNARQTIEEVKWNKEKLLPLISDIQIFRDFLKLKAEDAYKYLNKSGFSISHWRTLVEMTAALVLTFNRKRPGETERILLKNYYSKQTVEKESEEYTCLTTLEKLLCDSLKRVEIRGKRERRVPILLRTEIICYIDKFLLYRQEANVSIKNIYLFGIGENSFIHITDIIRRESLMCGANQTHLLRTHLRKQVATTSQVLEMNENEMQLLADFMGHDIEIHKRHYRTPELTLQIAKLSKLLIAVDNGEVANYQGKNLQNLDIAKYLEITPDTEVDADKDDGNNSDPTEFVEESILKSATSDKKTNNKIQRRTWKTTEINAVKELFPLHLKNFTLPSEAEIYKLVKLESRLATRTTAQIKAYINNTNKKKIRNNR